MIAIYHQEITRVALAQFFTGIALERIISANLNQDQPYYQVGHPYFHHDDSSFSISGKYLADLRQEILETLRFNTDIRLAWEAFGRLTHSVQDFYAHSNYIALWLSCNPDPAVRPEQITPLDPGIMNSPTLHSGHIYHGIELLGIIPWIGRWIKYYIPADSHTWMNLDTPLRGPLFPFAHQAAIKRTRLELETISQQITEEVSALALSRFRGLEPPLVDV